MIVLNFFFLNYTTLFIKNGFKDYQYLNVGRTQQMELSYTANRIQKGTAPLQYVYTQKFGLAKST